MFAANKEGNFVSKSIAMFKQHPGQVLLIVVCMLVLVYCIGLNFAAIGQMINFGTGIHSFVAIVGFLIFTQLIKRSDSDGDGIGKYVSQALYLTMGAISLYWVFQYSDWQTYNKVILITFHVVAYSAIIGNMFISKKEK